MGRGPDAIAITPNGKTAYIVNGGSDTLTPIQTATNKALKPIKVGRGPDGIAITPNGQTAYVANSVSDTVTPIRTATNKAGKAIKVGSDPGPIAITPNGETAYVVDARHLWARGDPDPDRHQHRAQGDQGRVPPVAIAITPNGKTAYVANAFSDTVTPIRTATNAARKAIAVGSFPASSRSPRTGRPPTSPTSPMAAQAP